MEHSAKRQLDRFHMGQPARPLICRQCAEQVVLLEVSAETHVALSLTRNEAASIDVQYPGCLPPGTSVEHTRCGAMNPAGKHRDLPVLEFAMQMMQGQAGMALDRDESLRRQWAAA